MHPFSNVQILEFFSQSKTNAVLSQNRIDGGAGITFIIVLVMGCFAVLCPFLFTFLMRNDAITLAGHRTVTHQILS